MHSARRPIYLARVQPFAHLTEHRRVARICSSARSRPQPDSADVASDPEIRGLRRLATVVAAAVLLSRPVETQTVAAPPAEAKKEVERPFVVGPYLQYPTRDSITIVWETAEPGTSVVEYGPSLADLKDKVEVKEPSAMHEVTLTKLTPNSKYIYRVSSVVGDKTLTDGPYQFGMAVDEDSAYSFGVIGDTQRNPAVTAEVAKIIYDRRPNFVIHNGDVVDDGRDKKQWVGDLFGPCHDLFARAALIPTIGNHEKNHAYYYQYFSLPKPEYYYSFKYGNAEFFAVDTNKKVGPDSEQYKWLDEKLGESKATWKFVFHHHPVWSSDDDDYGVTWKGPSKMGDANARDLVPLLEKHNVDIDFNGHIHVYERSLPLRNGKIDHKTGVRYITSGGGGGSWRTSGRSRTGSSARRASITTAATS